MLPWLIGGALLAGAAALWYFLRKKKDQKKNEPENEAPPALPEDEPGDETPEAPPPPEKVRVVHRTDEAIKKIVDRLTFATGQVIRKQVKVGEETRESIIPTDEVVVRPMRNESELTRALSGAHAQEDDQFYAAVAARSVPITSYQEQVDLHEDITEPTRNVMVLLQDLSDSMKDEGRTPWSMALDKRIIGKAQAEKAEVAFLPFGSNLGNWLIARTDEERAELRQNLERKLYFMGGTALDAAILEGIRYVSDPSFTERKIVLVTDGTQNVSVGTIREALLSVGAELHTICVGPSNSSLQAVSTHYDHLGDDSFQ